MIQPYILGALAVICYAACMLLHPASASFRAGWKFARAWPWTWLVLGVVGAHHSWWVDRKETLWFGWPQDFSPAFASELILPVATQAGNSVAASLVMPLVAEPLSVVLALAVFLNLSEIGLALKRGCKTAFPKGGTALWRIFILCAMANVGWLACLIGGWLPERHWGLIALHVLGLPWSGATVAFALAWLVRLAETHLQAPEEILQIQWPGSAAGRIPRLWPILLGSSIAQGWAVLADSVTFHVGWSLRILGWIAAIAAAFLPLLLVHWRGDWTWRTAFNGAAQRWSAQWPKFLSWAALAYTHFFLLHLAHQGIASGLPVASIWRLGWDTLCSLLHAALLVWLLVAWIAQQPKFREEEFVE
jgi:hypothetical protein